MPTAPTGDSAVSLAEIAALALSAADRETLTGLANAGTRLIALSGCEGADDVARIAARIAVAEAEAGIAEGEMLLVPSVDRPGLALGLADLRSCTPRLAALAIDPAGLAGTLGLEETAAPVATARSLVVLAAAALGRPALLLARSAPDAATRAAAAGAGFAGVIVLAEDGGT